MEEKEENDNDNNENLNELETKAKEIMIFWSPTISLKNQFMYTLLISECFSLSLKTLRGGGANVCLSSQYDEA